MTDHNPSEGDIVEAVRELLAKATPEPWEARRSLIHVEGKGTLATVSNPWDDEKEREANAELIALAPQMARELLRISPAMKGGDDPLSMFRPTIYGILLNQFQGDVEPTILESLASTIADAVSASRFEAQPVVSDAMIRAGRNYLLGFGIDDMDNDEVGGIYLAMHSAKEG